MSMTPAEAASFLRAASGRVHEELVAVAETVVQGAKLLTVSYIGHQQEDWAPLSGATIYGFRHAAGFWIEGKEALGFSGPDFEPLLRSGQMQASYETAIEEEPGRIVAAVGSDDKIALYQEMGTPDARYPIPGRPALAQGLTNMIPEAELLLAEAMVSLLTPE